MIPVCRVWSYALNIPRCDPEQNKTSKQTKKGYMLTLGVVILGGLLLGGEPHLACSEIILDSALDLLLGILSRPNWILGIEI